MISIRVVLGTVVFAALGAFAADPNICKAIPTSDLERVQNAKLLLTKPAQHDDGKLTTASCYFRMDPEAQSVSLEIISRSKGDSIDPREFWESRFEPKDRDNDGEAEERSEARERHQPPQKIAGLGDEAYWVDTGRDGALYVLANSRIIRLSLGGRNPQSEKREKAVQLSRLLVSH